MKSRGFSPMRGGKGCKFFAVKNMEYKVRSWRTFYVSPTVGKIKRGGRATSSLGVGWGPTFLINSRGVKANKGGKRSESEN